MGSPDPIDGMRPDELDRLIESWRNPSRPLSRHLELAASAAIYRQRRNRPPLGEGKPIPGCDCEGCTGVPKDSPARRMPRKSRNRRTADRTPLDVDTARAMPIVEVAEKLGLGRPKRIGKEYVCLCPLHEDRTPSLRLDSAQGVWYCDPCGEGGDGIRLVERAHGCSFAEAIRELVGS